MAVKKRCGFCRKVLRQDTLTCKNPNCPRYVPDPPSEDTETPSTGESTQSEDNTAEPSEKETSKDTEEGK